MQASIIQSTSGQSTAFARRFLFRFVPIALILIAAMFAAIRIRLLVLEARNLSQEIIDERTVTVAFDEAVVGEGWSEPETGFIWTVQPRATMQLSSMPGWYHVAFDAETLTHEQLQSVELLVNGVEVELNDRRVTSGYRRFEGTITEGMLRQSGENILTFAVDRVLSPRELGREDPRQLGLRLDWFQIEPIVPPETTQTAGMYPILLLSVAVASTISLFVENTKRHPIFAAVVAAAAFSSVGIVVLLPEIAVSQLVYFLVFTIIIATITILWTPSAYTASGGKSLGFHLSRLWDNRVLLYIWTRYNVLSRYSQAFLGILWIVIQPLATSLILALVFSRILRAVDTGGAPYISFYMAAVIPWMLFSIGLNNGMMSLIGAAGLIEQVYFPREIVVLVKLGETLVDVSFTFVAMLILNAVVGIYPNWHYLYLPVLLLIQVAFMMGIMFFVSYLSMLVRDVPQLVMIVLQFMFYLTPILYPIEAIPPELKFIALVNPLASLVDAYRSVILYNTAPDFPELYYTIVTAGVLLYSGYMFFKKNEKRVADFI